MITIYVCNGELKIQRSTTSDICEAVYMLTMLIPIGRVTSYSIIGRALGVSPRVVAYCLSVNEKPVIIPCHRVVYSDGRLGGYSAGGMAIKRRLLELEGIRIIDNRVDNKHMIDPINHSQRPRPLR